MAAGAGAGAGEEKRGASSSLSVLLFEQLLRAQRWKNPGVWKEKKKESWWSLRRFDLLCVQNITIDIFKISN